MSQDPIALGERIVTLLEAGSFVTTYKYAVLLGLMDICIEQVQDGGLPPQVVTTRQLAEKVVALYWDHVRPFGSSHAPDVLRQGLGGQARIVRDVADFRARLEHDRATGPSRARALNPVGFEKLVREVEWKLIQMPLPRLQILGGELEPFLYAINWGEDVRVADVREYQKHGTGPFDNRIIFQLDVAAQLIRLAGLLRPIIQIHWTEHVRRINKLERNLLEDFLFAGRSRAALTPLREGLRELQGDRCFYCGQRIGSRAEVDHFIPWARFPNDSIQNLVLADTGCNNNKRDFLAAADHLERWAERLTSPHHQDLAHLAEAKGWESDTDRMRRVASALYLNLGPESRLWQSVDRFAKVDHVRMVRIFVDAAD